MFICIQRINMSGLSSSSDKQHRYITVTSGGEFLTSSSEPVDFAGSLIQDITDPIEEVVFML